MKTSITWGASVLLCTSLSAQTFTSISGYETTQGNGYCNVLGIYRDGRQQFCFADHVGGTAKVLGSISMRRSTRSNTNEARSWANMEIRIGTADFTKMTDDWNAMLNAPTTVFSAKAAFAGTTGAPSQTPAPWGNFAAPNDMTFPFSAKYVYTATDALTVDFRFTGGTLNNGASWGATSGVAYYVDGYLTAGPNSWVERVGTVRGSTSCLATGATNASYLNTWMMSEYIPGGNAQHRWQWYGYNYPASSTVVVAASVNGNAAGAPFLASCQNVFLDLSKPIVLAAFMSNANGEVFSPFLQTPFLQAAVGVPLWTQGAFDDGSPATLQLSRPGETPIPSLPGTKPTHFSSRLYHPDKSRPLGYGPYDHRTPIFKFN